MRLGTSWNVLAACFAGLVAAAALAQPQEASRAPARNLDLSTARTIPAPSQEAITTLNRTIASAPAVEVAKGEARAQLQPPARSPQIEAGKLYYAPLPPSAEQTIAKQFTRQFQSLGKSAVLFSGVWKQLAKDGSLLALKAALIPQPAAPDPATGRFVGSLKVGVYEIPGPAQPKALSFPITFQVLEDGVADPNEQTVQSSGELKEIKISSPTAADGVKVTVASPFNPEGTPVVLPLASTFSLSVTKSIEGLGLEAANVSVMTSGLAQPDGRIVQLSVDGPAKAEDEQLRLDKDGRASTKLRSVGTGSADVTANLTGFRAAQARVNLKVPFLTIFASALGGLTGGLIKNLESLRRGSSRRFLLRLTVALLVGIVVFGLYAVGVNVLPFKPTVNAGAVLVFVVSAVGAYLGAGILGSAAPERN